VWLASSFPLLVFTLNPAVRSCSWLSRGVRETFLTPGGRKTTDEMVAEVDNALLAIDGYERGYRSSLPVLSRS
jgi:pyruvate kinase